MSTVQIKSFRKFLLNLQHLLKEDCKILLELRVFSLKFSKISLDFF